MFCMSRCKLGFIFKFLMFFFHMAVTAEIKNCLFVCLLNRLNLI